MRVKSISIHSAAIVFAAAALFLTASSAAAQTGAQTGTQDSTAVAANIAKDGTPVKATSAPYLSSYRDVAIGALSKDIIDKLGKPKFKDDSSLLFDLSKSETLQIKLSPDSKAVTVAAIFSDAESAPKFSDVFGPATVEEPRADGSIYKMIRYPEAGFWVSYFRGAGKDATVAVTIQKL